VIMFSLWIARGHGDWDEMHNRWISFVVRSTATSFASMPPYAHQVHHVATPRGGSSCRDERPRTASNDFARYGPFQSPAFGAPYKTRRSGADHYRYSFPTRHTRSSTLLHIPPLLYTYIRVYLYADVTLSCNVPPLDTRAETEAQIQRKRTSQHDDATHR